MSNQLARPPRQRNETTARFRFFAWWGRIWDKIEAWWGNLGSNVRSERRRLGERGRLVGAGVAQVTAEVTAQFTENLVARFEKGRFQAVAESHPPVSVQFYGHGAFMGAAPALLRDERWRRILAFLMPDVFDALSAAIEANADPSTLMPMMENNPVAAAFGEWKGAERRDPARTESEHHLSGIEWDLFVDADLLDDWHRARGDAPALERVMARVIDTALVAHANATDTVQEAMGICQYRDVRKTPKTAMGGVEIDSWVDLFGRALHLANAPDLDAALREMERDPRSDADEACMQHTFAPTWPLQKTVELYRARTGKPCLSIVIDIKSLRSTPEFLADVVRTLNAKGIRVAAVGSFLRDEIEGVGQVEQRVDGVTYAPPREVQFFHFAGDLQHACDAGHVTTGQSVLFNGASLIEVTEREGQRPVYAVKQRVVDELEVYRQRFDLHIGYYVQEGDCDHEAVALLSGLCNRHPQTFEFGFAWGGLRDEANLARSDKARVGYGSQRMLEYVGTAKQWQTGRIGAPPPTT